MAARKRKKITWISIVGYTLLGLVVLFVGSVSAFYFYITWQGDSGPMLDVANRFKPLDGWELVSEDVRPPGHLCIDNPCHSMYRAYSVKSEVSRDDFVKFIKQGGFKESDLRDCPPNLEYASGIYARCRTTKKVINGYIVWISVTATTSDEDYFRVSVGLEKKGARG